MSNSKRKQHFVDGAAQGTIMGRMIAHWLFFLFVTGAFVVGIEALSSDVQQAFTNLISRHGTTILVVMVLLPIFIYDLCVLTHRLVGPMVCLKRAMRDLADGRDVRHIHFRERDFCQELAIDFNRVVDRFQAMQHTAADEFAELAMANGSSESV